MTSTRRSPRVGGGEASPPRLRPPAHQVSRRAIAHWAIDYLLGWALASGLAWGAAAWIDASGWHGLPDWLTARIWWVPVTVTVVGVLMVGLAPVWRYRVHRWEVSSDVIYTRTGWFNRQWLLVPVSRVQTVDTEQGWLERLLGLATLKVNTASHAGSSEVAGLPVDLATRLAREIAHRAHTLPDDAT